MDGTTPVVVVIDDPADVGARADVVLARHVPGLSRRVARSMAREGRLRIDGKLGTAATEISVGMRLELSVRAPTGPEVELEVLRQTAGFVFVNKPAGVHTVRIGPEDAPTLSDAVAQRYPECGELREAGALHRLDLETTGVVAFARTRASFDRGRAALTHDAVKLYVAIAEGEPDPWPPVGMRVVDALELPEPWSSEYAAVEVSAPLRRFGPRGALVRVDPEGDEAVSTLWPLRAENDATWVCVRLATGRQHQARAHLRHVGLPIRGDTRYGSSDGGALLLHAWLLDLGLPAAGEGPVVAPLPGTFPPFA